MGSVLVCGGVWGESGLMLGVEGVEADAGISGEVWGGRCWSFGG